MKRLIVILIMAASLSACNTKIDHTMSTTKIFPQGEQLPKEWFTGNAFLQPLVAKDKNNDFSAGSVTFTPGARTNWHTHPKGQVLLVIEGNGLYQEKGKPAQSIKKGDVINIPENVKHWHGATADSQMVHVAITNFKEDTQVTWLEPVTEEEFILANK
ncbi:MULTISPECIES: (R)-mandelonitrile lyase [Sphingobacterium]|uniref:(R)-mandelonitrile lyase n=1 Tax=Sphingobacterium TaxID=28453 RepID=UPI00257FFDDB|nr:MULTISPECIES: cupin domain-containing protein [Sphingobacterium]